MRGDEGFSFGLFKKHILNHVTSYRNDFFASRITFKLLRIEHKLLNYINLAYIFRLTVLVSFPISREKYLTPATEGEVYFASLFQRVQSIVFWLEGSRGKLLNAEDPGSRERRREETGTRAHHFTSRSQRSSSSKQAPLPDSTLSY